MKKGDATSAVVTRGAWALGLTTAVGTLPAKMFDKLNASVSFPRCLGRLGECVDLAIKPVRNSYFNDQSIRLDGAIRVVPRKTKGT